VLFRSIPAHRRQGISVIRRSGEHLLSLIEGTLDLARIEGGRLTLQQRPIDLADFVQQTARMIEVQARAKGIAFELVQDKNMPAVVRADDKRLRQILINVLGNAVKFTARGKVRFIVHYARDLASFEIEDSGPGIAPDELEHIFEPFVRGSAAQGAAAGSGLGLTIARMLTHVMGGELSATSTPGVGSRFVVRLYLPQLADVAVAAPSGARRVAYTGARRRILIVDNEAVDRELMAGALAPLGFLIDQAASGEECLEVLSRFRPDVILMDLAMPGMDGWETIRVISRERLSDARIAIVSANAFDKGLENDLGITADDFITKPVRFDELLDWLGRALNLDWIEAIDAPAATTATEFQRPPAEALAALAEQVGAGYVRGIHAELDKIGAAHPECTEFVRRLRELAQSFRIDDIAALLKP
jgi:CheY-like chemotaxis protein